jgi:hypothetical protein
MLKEPLDYYDYYVTQAVESSKVTWCVYRGRPESAWGVMACASREDAIGRAISMAKLCRAGGRHSFVRLRESASAPWRVMPLPVIARAA